MMVLYFNPIIKLLKNEDFYRGMGTYDIKKDISERLRKYIFYNKLYYNSSSHNGTFIRYVTDVSDVKRTEDGLFNIYFSTSTFKKQNAIFDNGFRVYNDGLYIKCDNEEDFLDFKESFLRGIPEERRCEYDLLLSLE